MWLVTLVLRHSCSNASVTPPARLVLIRHGQTATNAAAPGARMSGWTDFPLSPKGWEQVRALGARLRFDSPVDAIYSSPLMRARHTAGELLECRSAPLRLLDELREIHCGVAEGMRIAEVKEKYRELWAENLRQQNEHFRWPGGESYAEMRARSLAVIDRIARSHPGERVVVVTHCGLISQVLGFIHGISPAQWERYRPENASLTELEWKGTDGRVISFNDHTHLQTRGETNLVAV